MGTRRLHRAVTLLRGPFKGIGKANQECVGVFSKHRLLTISKGLEGFTQLREARRNHFYVPLRLHGAELWPKTLRVFLSSTVAGRSSPKGIMRNHRNKTTHQTSDRRLPSMKRGIDKVQDF